MNKTLSIILIISVVWVVSCGEENPREARQIESDGGKEESSIDSASAFWEEVLEDLVENTRASAYSLGYYPDKEIPTQPSDSKPFIRSVFFPFLDSSGCVTFENELMGQSTGQSIWFLQIELSSNEVGEYTIVPELELFDNPKPHGIVMLKKTAGDGEKVRRTALTGTIKLERAAANLQEWQEGINMEIEATVEFPYHDPRNIECYGSVEIGTDAEPESTCLCREPDGSESTCIKKEGEYSCCHDFESPTKSASFRFKEVEQCGTMCAATSLVLLRNCQQLQNSE